MARRSSLRRLVWGLLAFFAWVAPAQAASLYPIGPKFGSIGFSVGSGWLLSASGAFDRFHGQLLLDLADPQATRITVTIEAGSIMMGWSEATDMARSAPFFDVARYKEIHFESNHVTEIDPTTYRIAGTLEIRGITRPQTLLAHMVHLGRAPGQSRPVADFVAVGTLRRSSFGMMADRILVGDVVHLSIHARILLRGDVHG